MKNRKLAKTKLTLALIPPALVAVISFAAPKAILTRTNLVSSAAVFKDATANYTKYCARCHGGDGRSQTAKGRQTNASDLTKSRIGNAAGMKIIANGKELMPGFKDNLSAEEISALMNYVRGFRQ